MAEVALSAIPTPSRSSPSSMTSGDVKVLFKEIGDKFGWDPLIAAWITDSTSGLGATSLDDFLYVVTKGDDLGFIADQAKVANKVLQTSRVRQAWAALTKDRADADKIREKGLLEVDLDVMLPRPELDDLNVLHHRRHKLSWPPETAPGDQLVSRFSRELDKRLLCLKDVWKVRTQAQQQRAKRKRKDITEDVQVIIDEPEDDEDGIHDVTLYLAYLETAMIAYSIAGIKPVASPTHPENRGTRSTEVVQCPLDVVMRYFYRARNRASRMAPSDGLKWLIRKDEDERSVWVDKYRNSNATLGEIIAETMMQREAMWEIERAAKATPPPPGSVLAIYDPRVGAGDSGGGNGNGGLGGHGGKGNGGKGNKGNGGDGGDKVKVKGRPKQVARAFKDGTTLCAAFQTGYCKAKDCKQGKHACGAVTKTKRVCGGNHPACKCGNKNVPRK